MKTIRLIALLFSAIAATALSASTSALAASAAIPALVQAPQGPVAGVISDAGIRVFKGIPYAKPPVGDARWKPPVPVADWTQVRDASHFGPACPQPPPIPGNIYSETIPAMSEDCLTLNVWAPKDAHNLPVMVWIHGGALVTGYAGTPGYEASHLVQQGVIVVSIQYRLGVLGYIAHPALSAESPRGVSGNYGLLDQIEALKWVQRNISAFGGDPGNVTVFGQSAGALSTMYLLASPLAKGLLHKAILQSGYMPSTPELKKSAYGMPSGEQMGLILAGAVKAPDLAALRAMDAATLVTAGAKLGFLAEATVDGWAMPKQPVDIFDAGEQAHVPVIAGLTSGEVKTLRTLLPPTPESPATYEAEIRQRYGDLADRQLQLYPTNKLEDSLLATVRDNLYAWMAGHVVRAQTRAGSPAYLYYFDHGYPAADSKGLHAFHASEIAYTFGNLSFKLIDNPDWPQPPDNPQERAMANAMVGYWTSFAKNGVPSARGEPTWQPFASGDAYMDFAEKPTASNNLLQAAYALSNEVICRRRHADQAWIINYGIASPPVPAKVPACAPANP